jgi:hypothetical protein
MNADLAPKRGRQRRTCSFCITLISAWRQSDTSMNSQTDEKPRRRLSKQLPTHDEFRRELAKTLAATGTKQLTSTIRLLTKGYEPQATQTGAEPEVSSVVEELAASGLQGRIALRLAHSALWDRKKAGLAPRVFRGLATRIVRDLGCPLSDGVDGITAWLDRTSAHLRAAGNEASQVEENASRVLICLLNHPDSSQRARLVLHALDGFFGGRSKRTNGPFLRALVGALPKAGGFRVIAEVLSDAMVPYREAASAAEARAQDLAERLEAAQEKLADFSGRSRSLTASLEERMAEMQQLREAIESLKSQLSDERGAAQAREIHWREKGRSDLVAFASRTKAKLLQEIGEAILALESTEPAVDMTLNRLRRVERAVSALDQDIR